MVITDARYDAYHRINNVGSVQTAAQSGLDYRVIDFFIKKILKSYGGINLEKSYLPQTFYVL